MSCGIQHIPWFLVCLQSNLDILETAQDPYKKHNSTRIVKNIVLLWAVVFSSLLMEY